MPFQCSICEEPSTRICVRCTKDACENHLCEKCLKCSDCCECEVTLEAAPRTAPVVHTAPEPEPAPTPAPSEEAGPEAEGVPLPEPSLSDAPELIPAAEPEPPAVSTGDND